jgi:glyoxylase-like metal-dependent hydrolase (beta-lactamase superfamily II)
MQYRILETGFFYADGGAMFGAIPKRAWNRKYPSDDQNACVLAMNCLLAWEKEKVILLDTGVGNKELGKLSYYRFFDTKNIVDLVREQGFEPEQVTDVVLSHLHFDHCGGCTCKDSEENLKIAFPKAKHWAGASQWNNYLNPNGLEKDSFRSMDMMPVKESGLLQLVTEDFKLYPGFTVGLYEGHTTGQLAVSFDSEQGQTVLFAGDVIPTKAHWPNEWISAYDTHPLQSLEAKIKIKKEIENKNTCIVFYHDAYHKSLNYNLKK